MEIPHRVKFTAQNLPGSRVYISLRTLPYSKELKAAPRGLFTTRAEGGAIRQHSQTRILPTPRPYSLRSALPYSRQNVAQGGHNLA